MNQRIISDNGNAAGFVYQTVLPDDLPPSILRFFSAENESVVNAEMISRLIPNPNRMERMGRYNAVDGIALGHTNVATDLWGSYNSENPAIIVAGGDTVYTEIHPAGGGGATNLVRHWIVVEEIPEDDDRLKRA